MLPERLEALVSWMRERAQRALRRGSSSSTSITCRSACSPNTPGSAGLARTRASSTARSARGLFLAGVAVSLELPADAAGADQCGACTPLHRRVSHRRARGRLRARRDPLHLVPHDRARWTDSGSAAGGHRRSRLWLRHLSGGLPVEPRAAGDARPRVAAAPGRVGHRCGASCGSGPTSSLHDLVAGIGDDTHAMSRLRRNLAVVLGNSGDRSAPPSARSPGRRHSPRGAQCRDAARPGTCGLGEAGAHAASGPGPRPADIGQLDAPMPAVDASRPNGNS